MVDEKIVSNEARKKAPRSTARIVVEVIVWFLVAMFAFLTFLLWAQYGRYLYDGAVFYTSGESITSYHNIYFSHLSGDSYQAKLFGIFPVGIVTIQEKEREYVALPVGGIVCWADAVDGAMVISSVLEGSPAAEAGLEAYDMIYTVDDYVMTATTEVKTFEPNTTHRFVCTNGKVLDITTDDTGSFGFSCAYAEPVLGTMSFEKDGYFYAFGHTVGGARSDLPAWQVGLTVTQDDVYFRDFLANDAGMAIIDCTYGVLGAIGTDWQTSDEEVPVAWWWEIAENEEAEVLIGCEDGTFKSYTGIVKNHTAVYVPDDPDFSAQYNYQICLTDGNQFKEGLSGSPIVQNGQLIGILAVESTEDSTIGYFCPAESAVLYLEDELADMRGYMSAQSDF